MANPPPKAKLSLRVSPNDLLLYARVVDERSFSRAAERLALPKSTVSRRVSALERQLGERLLLRTTRKLTVTDFGLAVLEHGRHVAEDVAAAEALAHNLQIKPSGRLRVTMPSDLANVVLAPFLAQFALDYPAISLEVDLSARFVDLVGENFDVAIRMGDLRDDATLAARKVAVFSVSLYAAPSYLARRGMPSEPEALMEHDALLVLGRNGDAMPWVLTRGDERWEGHATGPGDGQLTGAPDAHGPWRRRHHRRQRSLRDSLSATSRARPDPFRLEAAGGERVGCLPGAASHARAHTRLSRSARCEVERSRMPGNRGATGSRQGEVQKGAAGAAARGSTPAGPAISRASRISG
jgi:DNA-binding transcriptional LysR family regulator